MTYNITWQTENQVLFIEIKHDISIEDLQGMSTEIQDIFSEMSNPLHIIFQTKSLRDIPTNLMEIQRNTSFLHHPNMGMIVMVGASPLVSYLASTVTAFAGIKLRNAPTVPHAINLLKNIMQEAV